VALHAAPAYRETDARAGMILRGVQAAEDPEDPHMISRPELSMR
jgi:hypothetical protein